MATGGSEETMCPLCLDPFTLPKFLPCFHTFCQHCIEDLVKGKTDASFLCPSCRRTTTLPPGGAADLQTNFYIKNSDGTTRTQPMCGLHPGKELEFYCTECEEAICLNCNSTRHKTHNTDDLAPVIVLKRLGLLSDRQRLQKAVSDIKTDVDGFERERTFLSKQTSAVERRIKGRHAAIVKASETHMMEELESLKIKHTDQDKEIIEIIKQHKTTTTELSSLLQQTDDVINSGTAKHVLRLVKEMRSGRGSQTAIECLTSREQRPTLRPDLYSTVSDDDMNQTTRDYLGTVRVMEMKVTHKFQCSQDANTEVFSLCHLDSDPPQINVSYDRLGMNENAPVQKFRESGQCVLTDSMVGRISSKRYTKGWSMHPIPTSGVCSTFNKSPASIHFKLENNMSGQADINRITVTTTDPLKTESKTEFTINIGRHRSFDCDCTMTYFAVVTEGETDTPSSHVHLYEKPKKAPASTYQPPMENFQPTDVLFHTIGGQPVLVVADRLNSALHVLSFQGGQLEFQYFLCPGCPLLQQPSALCVDLEGRLWLACRNNVLTIESVEHS